MGLLTDEQLKAIEGLPDGKAIAEKLSGDFIPKSRFDEVIGEKNKHAEALAKIEADRKAAEDDRARKAGEFEKLAAADKARIAELEKGMADEKAIADLYRASHAARIAAMKKDFGDAWLPEYETFSMTSLDKLAESHKKATPGKTDNGRPGPVAAKPWDQMTSAERNKMIEDVKARRQVAV